MHDMEYGVRVELSSIHKYPVVPLLFMEKTILPLLKYLYSKINCLNHNCVDLFLDLLFCSIDLYVHPYANTTLSFFLYVTLCLFECYPCAEDMLYSLYCSNFSIYAAKASTILHYLNYYSFTVILQII